MFEKEYENLLIGPGPGQCPGPMRLYAPGGKPPHLLRLIGPGPWCRPGTMSHRSRAMPRPGTDDPLQYNRAAPSPPRTHRLRGGGTQRRQAAKIARRRSPPLATAHRRRPVHAVVSTRTPSPPSPASSRAVPSPSLPRLVTVPPRRPRRPRAAVVASPAEGKSFAPPS